MPSLSRRRRNRPHRPKGQGLVEFALVLPLLLLVLLLAVDFGRAFYSWVILQNASRLGANYAALNPEGWKGSGIPTIQSNFVTLVTDDWDLLPCPDPGPPAFADGTDGPSGAGLTPDTAFDVGDTVRVTLACPFSPLTPIISNILGNTIQLRATSEFRIRSGDIAGIPVPVRIPPPCYPVPDLTMEAGVPETVADARAEWDAAGFTGTFTPSSGVPNETVLTQDPPAGGCVPANTPMTVTHT
jgi:hypothetical protein